MHDPMGDIRQVVAKALIQFDINCDHKEFTDYVVDTTPAYFRRLTDEANIAKTENGWVMVTWRNGWKRSSGICRIRLGVALPTPPTTGEQDG